MSSRRCARPFFVSFLTPEGHTPSAYSDSIPVPTQRLSPNRFCSYSRSRSPPPSYAQNLPPPSYSRALAERLRAEYGQKAPESGIKCLMSDIVDVWATVCVKEGSSKRADPKLVVEKMLSELKEAQGEYSFAKFVDIIVDMVVEEKDPRIFGVVVNGREVRIDMADVMRNLMCK